MFLAEERRREGRRCCCLSWSSLKSLETLYMYMSMLYTDEIPFWHQQTSVATLPKNNEPKIEPIKSQVMWNFELNSNLYCEKK